jgi:phenylalanyl-tRNA synthetase beta chain
VRVPLGWLREYVELDASTDAIVAKLAMLGFPVEEVERRPQLSGVVAGKLLDVRKHPNADRLQVCRVDAGRDEPLTIATAAANVAAGQIVPVAIVGAKLVGKEIAPVTMRGVASRGMLVSADEIGLPAAWFEDGILQLEAGVKPGTDLIGLYRLNDDVIEIEVTSNRVDVMSIVGVARELGAAFGTAVREPIAWDGLAAASNGGNERQARAGDLTLSLESPACRRYVAQRFSGPGPRTAPLWMRVRLALAGQRPISDLVDVTNYVMCELGQPLHVFDYGRLSGGTVVVREAGDGERLVTLDEVERTLDRRILAIADAQQPIAVAGVIGGIGSEANETTREIVIESANFDPARVRRSARAIGVRTEASSRHEKTLSLALADAGAARAAALLTELGWQGAGAFAAGRSCEPPAAIPVSAGAINRLLGFALSDAEVESALRSLGFTLSAHGGTILASAPPWRSDVAIEADLAEEVARIAGYERVPSLLPAVPGQNISSEAYERENTLAERLAALGYREAIALSLQPGSVRAAYQRAGIEAPEAVEVENPLSEDQRWLRFSLLPGLLAIAARRRGAATLRLFEIGHVFRRGDAPDAPPVETAMCAFLAVEPERDEPAWRDSAFLELSGDASALLRSLTGRAPEPARTAAPELHPGKTAALRLEGRDVVVAGALNPKLAAAFDVGGNVYAGLFKLEDIPACVLPTYTAPSRFPPIERDLAVVVAPEIGAAQLSGAVRASGGTLVREVRVFDEYRGPQVGEGLKSVAVRIVLQRTDATLTDADADAQMELVLASLKRLGATIRS